MIFLLVYFSDVINSVARESIRIDYSDYPDYEVGKRVTITLGVVGGIFIISSIGILIYNNYMQHICEEK